MNRLATATFASMLACTTALCAQQDGKPDMPVDFGFGYRINWAPVGLLGDLTNITPNMGGYMEWIGHIKKDSAALRFRISEDRWNGAWGKETSFRGSDGHTVKTSRFTVSLGLMLLFDSQKDPDTKHSVCLEFGSTRWNIDSSNYQPLKGNMYDRPMAGIHYGQCYKDMTFEVGVEACFLKTDNIDFKSYSKTSYTVTTGLGWRWRAIREK